MEVLVSLVLPSNQTSVHFVTLFSFLFLQFFLGDRSVSTRHREWFEKPIFLHRSVDAVPGTMHFVSGWNINIQGYHGSGFWSGSGSYSDLDTDSDLSFPWKDCKTGCVIFTPCSTVFKSSMVLHGVFRLIFFCISDYFHSFFSILFELLHISRFSGFSSKLIPWFCHSRTKAVSSHLCPRILVNQV
jgi:hypothetical protein